ncbi:LacI family DNA-binding transcriptional regulator [Maliponia aquimaris]|uniref:HTH-type transcriptional regulator MalR n=1 Tax=Maliponia aquimaris TaxID=1673631 RepID=A0A238KZ01_9RHOB|nr:LacI family DNA-binding transcriptional regulator [Maliponia aquimaris]SMX48045.1 HTH-type transcriptional regulator MalR [Maliponia aquimaris]
MAKRPTLLDVAKAAGVSIATVNRVVAAASGVRDDTARKVAEAAARVGYQGRNLAAQDVLRPLPEVRLGFVLRKEKQAFYAGFAKSLRRACAQVQGARVTAEIVFSDTQTPAEVAGHLLAMRGRADVVAATAVNHGTVAEAVARLAEAGVPCITLLSDFAQDVRAGYFGLNNLKVGRGAAQMLSIAAVRPGKIALFVGGNRWHGHELRETGFRSQFREAAPGFEVLDTLVNLETRQLTCEAMLDLMARHRDLVGVYLAGGGMEGAIASLREEARAGPIALVVNEVTPESRRALDDGYVSLIVATPLEPLCRELVAEMVQIKLEGGAMPGQRFFDPVLYLPEFG